MVTKYHMREAMGSIPRNYATNMYRAHLRGATLGAKVRSADDSWRPPRNLHTDFT